MAMMFLFAEALIHLALFNVRQRIALKCATASFWVSLSMLAVMFVPSFRLHDVHLATEPLVCQELTMATMATPNGHKHVETRARLPSYNAIASTTKTAMNRTGGPDGIRQSEYGYAREGSCG